MIIDKRQLDNVHWMLVNMKIEGDLSNDKETLALYDKYYNIYLNALILFYRGVSDERLIEAVDNGKLNVSRHGVLQAKISLEAAEIELKRRKENQKIEDIEVKIPFYFDPDFDWQRFNRTLSDQEKKELRDLITFLTKLAKEHSYLNQDGKRGLCGPEKTVYENAIYALHKGAGLSVEEIMSMVNSDEVIAKK